MKKRVTALLLAVVVSISLMIPALAAGSYSDVPADHWAAGSIDRATQLQIFNGVGGGKFGLGQPISRAAFITALVRLFGWETVSPASPTFTDVKVGDWYYAAVETAKDNGAIAAVGKKFRPTENITRQEMASMIVRSLGYTSLAGGLSTYSSPFRDVTTNKGFITVAYDLGIVSGIEAGKFAPNATATREQAAVMLVRVCEKLRGTSALLESAEGYTPLRIETPTAQEGVELPATPLEPMTELYAALRKLNESGTNMSKVVLCLTGGGVRTLSSNGRIVGSDMLTAEEIAEIMAEQTVRTHYSDRYESAYFIYQPNGYQTATVWYQSQESMAAKLQLARLFGVTKYILE